MKRNSVYIAKRRRRRLKQNQTATQKKPTPKNPRVMRKNISVNMVSTRSNKEQKAKEKTREEQIIPAKKTELETPDQSIYGIERRETESTPMPNTEEQEKITIEFSPIGNGDKATNIPNTIKDDSETKRTSFTERIAAMFGIKPREKEEITTVTEKSKTFGTVSTITTETRKDKEEATHEATACQDKRADGFRTTSVELGDLVTKLNEIDKKFKCIEEDRQELKKEKKHNRNENWITITS